MKLRIKLRLEQDLKDSVEAVTKKIERGNLSLHDVQHISTMLSQANGFAHQLLGVHLVEWSKD